MFGASVTLFEHVSASRGTALLRVIGTLRPGSDLGDPELVIARGPASERHVALMTPDRFDPQTGQFTLAFAVPTAAVTDAAAMTLQVGARLIGLPAPRARILATAEDREVWGEHVGRLGDRLAEVRRDLTAAEADAQRLGAEVDGAHAAARRAVVRARKLEMALQQVRREMAAAGGDADRTWASKLEQDLTAERRTSAALRRQALEQSDALATLGEERNALIGERDAATARVDDLERALHGARADVRRLELERSELLGRVERLTIAESVLRSEARDRIAGLASRLANLPAGRGGSAEAITALAGELDGVSRELGEARGQMVQAGSAGREREALERRLAEASVRLDAEHARTRDLEGQMMLLRAALADEGDGVLTPARTLVHAPR